MSIVRGWVPVTKLEFNILVKGDALTKIGFPRVEVDKVDKIEKDIVEAAHEAVKDIKNRMVKELIEGIASDSNKHASLLTSLLAAEEGKNPMIDEKVTDQLKENLENHIRLEQQAIDTYKELLMTVKGENEILIVKYILNDEVNNCPGPP